MRIGPLLGAIAVVALAGSNTAPRAAAAGAIACESLVEVPLANGKVTAAESVQAGAFATEPPSNASAAGAFKTVPAFCRVMARLTPSSDSDIRVEVWLPRS